MSDPVDSVKQYYRTRIHADRYNEVRFANAGGRLVDAWEKEILLDMLEGHPKDQPILEVAAGTGRFSLMLAHLGYSVTAVDSSPEMLNQLRETAETEGLAITCVHGDAFHLPFDHGAFQSVFSMRFVWHFRNIPEIINEMARVSSKTVVFDLTNRNSLAALSVPLANHVFYRSLHTELTTRHQAREIISLAGLQLVAEREAFAFPYIFYRRMPVFSKTLHALDRALLQWLPLGTVLYFKADKKPPSPAILEGAS